MTEEIEINSGESRREPAGESWFGLQAGTVLAGRYRIERLVSRGGMGAVFEATQLGLDRSVAIKVLLPYLSRDEKMQERFRREARSAAGLSHPNIIQIYDYGISEHGPYIVMEFLRGRSLRELVREGALPIGRAVELLEQTCSALATAHAAGIIHRDLKPDNLMIERQADGGAHVKVLDFGIAKMREAHAEEAETNLTGANLIGSPAYMSPEQCMGSPLDARSDLYSLGIVLYEMLTGETPFGKLAPPSMMMNHINTPPTPPSRMRGEITEGLEAVILKALAKDRETRFANVSEFAARLRLAVDDPDQFETRWAEADTLDAYATNSEARRTTGESTQKALKGPSNSQTGTLRRRLAILPLRNLAGDPEIEFLGFALTDSVITQLAPLKSLIVRPSSAVEKYRNQTIEPRIAGRELQVDTILSGSYLKAGEMFRVTVQLIDVPQNEILWQERIDLKFDNVIALQDRICDELIRGLRLSISTDEKEALKQDEVRNPLAYEFYLRGLAFGNATEEHKQAVQMLEAAVSMDPNYAPAWAALAGRYIDARSYLQDETMMSKAEAAANKALELKPNFPAALFWLAVYYGETGELKKAITVCKQLLRAAPNSEYAYQAMGHAYDYAGLPDVALTLFRKAVEINPVTYPYMAGFVLLQKGEYEEARKELEACPDSSLEKFFWLSIIDFIAGDRAAAIARLEPILARGGSGLFPVQILALLCAFRGEYESGRALLHAALSPDLRLGAYHYYITAGILAQLGDTEMALQMLWGAIKIGYSNYPFLMSDPLLAPLRETAEFADIAAAMKKLQTQLQLMLVTG
ncbi:MAG: protein kinase [Blastocatellia bacterium]|nr:protein kinase [Blastocatellia bacterium]